MLTEQMLRACVEALKARDVPQEPPDGWPYYDIDDSGRLRLFIYRRDR